MCKRRHLFQARKGLWGREEVRLSPRLTRGYFLCGRELGCGRHLSGQGSLRRGAGLRREGVIGPWWSPTWLEGIHRAGGSQLWPGRWSGDGCRQHEKGKLPEKEPTLTSALGPATCTPSPETGATGARAAPARGQEPGLRTHRCGPPSLRAPGS